MTREEVVAKPPQPHARTSTSPLARMCPRSRSRARRSQPFSAARTASRQSIVERIVTPRRRSARWRSAAPRYVVDSRCLEEGHLPEEPLDRAPLVPDSLEDFGDDDAARADVVVAGEEPVHRAGLRRTRAVQELDPRGRVDEDFHDGRGRASLAERVEVALPAALARELPEAAQRAPPRVIAQRVVDDGRLRLPGVGLERGRSAASSMFSVVRTICLWMQMSNSSHLHCITRREDNSL